MSKCVYVFMCMHVSSNYMSVPFERVCNISGETGGMVVLPMGFLP